MAKVFTPPTSLGQPPAFGHDLRQWQVDTEAWVKQVQEAAHATHRGDLVGEVVRFPVADGYAEYVVWSQRPLTLVHLGVYDGYQIPAAHMRGLTVTDLRDQIERARRWAQRTL